MSEQYHPARKVTVTAQQAGQRLDNFLFARFRQLPKTRIYKMLRKGEVRVNGGRIKQSYRIQAGDELRLPPVRLPAAGDDPIISSRDLQTIAAAVIHEDNDLLVINKPSGMAVHSGSGIAVGVIEIIRKLRPAEPFLELAHRLDRSTSGCLLLARHRAALTALHDLWRSGGVTKQYLALVAGQWQGGAMRVDMPLARAGAAGQVRATQVDEAGKQAVSHFEPVRLFSDATLMRVRIDTGRTHQIRVHAAELGYPLLGDDRYGDFQLNRQWKKRGLKRLFLHAQMLEFYLPGRVGEYHFEAPLPKELQQILDSIDG
jgi:23S rRNA pseudouridine955/2504/2580 synthase